MQSYPLTGGLDLRSGQTVVNPGTLAECLNYEVSDVDGYRRIDGFERYDGQFHVADFRAVRLRGVITGSFLAGDPVQWGADVGYVTQVAPGCVDVLFHSRASWPLAPPLTVTHMTGSGAVDVSAVQLLPRPTGKQRTVNAARTALADAARPRVGPVPGNPALPVAGVFWFKDRLYAIRDYPMVWFESVKHWAFRVGDAVTMPSGVYTVIVVNYTSSSHRAGYMLLWPLDVNTQRPMALLPSVGDRLTRPGDYIGCDLAGAAMGELPLAMLGDLSYGDSKAQVTGQRLDTPSATEALSLQTYRRSAGLWKATSTGWTFVDLKREAQFQSGTSAFEIFIAEHIGIGSAPITTSYQSSHDATCNGVDVTSTLTADDAAEAALSGQPSDEWWVTGFDFASIPDTATILGVEVRITRHADAGGKVRDGLVELVGLDGDSTNKAHATAWESTDTTVTYGGAADTWGNDNLLPSIIQRAEFGVRLTTQAVDTTPSGGIDSVSMRITYRRRDASVYVWSGSTDVAVNLVDVQLIHGDYASNDATGWLVLDIPGAGWGPSINNGMQLRSAPHGGGDLLATIDSEDQHIHMPGWLDLAHNHSQYRFLNTNFYGMDEYESVYGVSGASPAFTYDGSRLLWVRTTLPNDQDMPRHIARHGGSLVLGYYHGAYILSAVGNPTNFRGVDGAASIEIGEQLTNLMPAMGDALLVTSQTQTRLLRGLSPDTYQQHTVSASRGALEYTGANVGRLLVTDALGVAAADATPAFGDLSRTYISMAVEQWLTTRLSSTLGSASSDQQPVRALAVRRKNQYRLYFRDGYILTMTSRDRPQFTLQRYFRPATNGEDEGFPLSTVCTGIDIEGRERVFGSFDADANRGYVVELDHGTTFDGAPIPAHFTLNPLSFSDSVMLKRFDRLFLLGQAEGYASLSVSRTCGYDIPEGKPAWRCTFGAKEAPAGMRGARGHVDAPIEGYEVNIRVTSQADDEGPHVIQAMATDADVRGDSRGYT